MEQMFVCFTGDRFRLWYRASHDKNTLDTNKTQRPPLHNQNIWFLKPVVQRLFGNQTVNPGIAASCTNGIDTHKQISIKYTHTNRKYTQTNKRDVNTHTLTYIWTRATCTHTPYYKHSNIHTDTCTPAHASINTHTHTHTHADMNTHTYSDMNTHTQMWTHTRTDYTHKYI
jgi:hypothetical protein